MTLNEQIAKVMGFRCIDSPFGNKYYDKNENYIGEFHPEYNIIHAKLLQQRMQRDGWNILIMATAKDEFIASAWKNITLGHMTGILKSEEIALVELFCKVFNITEG